MHLKSRALLISSRLQWPKLVWEAWTGGDRLVEPSPKSHPRLVKRRDSRCRAQRLHLLLTLQHMSGLIQGRSVISQWRQSDSCGTSIREIRSVHRMWYYDRVNASGRGFRRMRIIENLVVKIETEVMVVFVADQTESHFPRV